MQDAIQLGQHNVSSIISVSHVFATFNPDGSGLVLLPDYEVVWAKFLDEMRVSGALQYVSAWYPADEPDIKMNASDLNTIVDVLKRDTPTIDV